MVKVIRDQLLHKGSMAAIGTVIHGLSAADEQRLIRLGYCEAVTEKDQDKQPETEQDQAEQAQEEQDQEEGPATGMPEEKPAKKGKK